MKNETPSLLSSPPAGRGNHRLESRSRRGDSLTRRLWRQIVPQLIATRIAWLMLLTILLLCAASLAAVRICGPLRLPRQEIHLVIGTVFLLLALIPAYPRLGRVAYLFYAFTCLLLAGVLFAPAIKGSHRWFLLPGGADFQPSELAKISFVMAVAWSLRLHRDCRDLSKLIIPFLLMLVPMGLILVESDLGTALLFPPVLYAMLIAAGARFRYLIAIALIALAVAPGCYPLLRGYQKQRIVALFASGKPSPAQLSGNLYQRRQSEIALGSGGRLGRGLPGADLIRHDLLPEAANDFIFSVVGSQWGFAGCMTILALYGVFFAACMEIAGNCADSFGRLMVVGLSSMMVLQATINIAMTTGLIPVVGITLPFMSYGGSALVADMLATSLILNVAMRRRRHSGPP